MYTNKVNKNLLSQRQHNIASKSISQNVNFQAMLQEQISKSKDLKFSKHAMDRLMERNIQLSAQEIHRINAAVDSAGKKGVKEALIVMDNKIFIASVNNRTIITAAMGEQLKNNIFTNIDGAIII